MLSSYLSDRTQLVCIEKSKSLQAPCNIGAPQGPILGPLLFMLYIIELPSICHSTQAIMYADNTVVFGSDQDINIDSKLSSDLATLHQWLHANHLTLNVKKTKCICSRTSARIWYNSVLLVRGGGIAYLQARRA